MVVPYLSNKYIYRWYLPNLDGSNKYWRQLKTVDTMTNQAIKIANVYIFLMSDLRPEGV